MSEEETRVHLPEAAPPRDLYPPSPEVAARQRKRHLANGEDAPPARRRRTFDEVMAEIDYYAFEGGEGADKFRALKMLAQQQSSSVFMSPPLGEQEVIERLARLMRGYPADVSRKAFSRAFKQPRKTIDKLPRVVSAGDFPEQRAIAQEIRTLKQLYSLLPELKRAGIPATYPRSKGMEAIQEWCRKRALECLIERERQRLRDLPLADTPTSGLGEDSGLPDIDAPAPV